MPEDQDAPIVITTEPMPGVAPNGTGIVVAIAQSISDHEQIILDCRHADQFEKVKQLALTCSSQYREIMIVRGVIEFRVWRKDLKPDA